MIIKIRDPSIKQYNIKTKKNTVICSAEDFITDIQVYNGRLYYTMYRNDTMYRNAEDFSYGFDLYSVDINGGNNKILLDNVASYIVYNNYIFYTYEKFSYPSINTYTSMYKYNIDNRNVTELIDNCGEYSPTYCIAYGKVYYYDDVEGCVISIDIVSGEKKVFRDANVSEATVLGQYLLYYNKHGDDYELRAYDITSGEYYYITSEFFPDGVSNRSLYFYDEYSGEFSILLKSLKIHNGKASVKVVLDYYIGDC